MLSLLAFGDVVIPLVAIFAIFGMPMLIGLVAILLRHQRQMSELVKGQSQGASPEDIQAIREEIRELKDAVMSHALSLDTNVRALAEKIESVEMNRLSD